MRDGHHHHARRCPLVIRAGCAAPQRRLRGAQDATERLGCREDPLGRGVEPDATSGSTVSDMEQTWRIGALAAETESDRPYAALLRLGSGLVKW